MERLQIEEEEIIQIESKNNALYEVSKRALDIIASFLGLIILSPILLIVAILIKLESKGPALFSQSRIGLSGEQFKMYKFRSMVQNAEELKDKLAKQNEMSGPMFKMKDDPRVTKVGKFIRKTSIDELPQLLNALKGEMSLVGPRPSLPKEVEKLRLCEVYFNLKCIGGI